MAINLKLAERVRTALAHLDQVEEKKMFRGLVFMVNGKMCISVSDKRIMCRVDPMLHASLIKMKNCEMVKMGGREYKGYLYVDEHRLKTKKDLAYWVGLALEFNKIAKASPGKNKSTRNILR